MATAGQVLKSAFQRIIVQASEAELTGSEFADAIFDMNNYMLDLDASGVKLGYTEVNNLGDQVTVPTGALRGVIANLAIDMSPDYNGSVTPGLVRAAKEGMKTMEKLGVSLSGSVFPSTLPVGSGNAGCSGEEVRYYPDLENEILAETTGAISLETGTDEAING